MADDNNNNRPGGREKNITGQGYGAYRRGEGTGNGPVGNQGGYSGRTGTGGYDNGTVRAGTGRGKLIGILIAVAVVVIGGGTGLSGIINNLLGGGSDIGNILGGDLSGYLSNFTSANVSTGWSSGANNDSALNTSVASGTRDRYTAIKGAGADEVTIMVYLCGTDLESKSGMATNDLREMTNAALSDKVNVVVLTGGCKEWKTTGISNTVNQIYKIENGSLKRLESDYGKGR